MATSPVARVALRAPSYQVNPYRGTAIPTRAELHLMNRLGVGYSRATLLQLRRAGGAEAWLRQQMRPGTVAESDKAKALADWFPDLRDSPARKWEKHISRTRPAWEHARILGNHTMMRRMYSNRVLLETMVDFWSNHLHVKVNADLAWVQRTGYDAVIRNHALGRFDDMLVAATLHPAMLLFLDNWRSVKDAPNENHGRELLELHTVGRTSGYTEEMVKDSARILSGYTVDVYASWNGYYDSRKHTTGPVQVLGFSAANGSADGSALARDYLRYLAHHPATARTIARKLAMRFVSDAPSDALVDELAGVFRRSGTDIKKTLAALVAHREFTASRGRKVRTPIDDMVHTVRVLGVSAQKPSGREGSFADAISWLHQGDLLYSWPRPDGPPDLNASWASASRMLGSFRMHWHLAGGYWPDVDVTYRRTTSWLPQRRIRFDQYVDHLCRLIHGKGSTSLLLKAAVQAVDVRPGEIVTKDHAVATWRFNRLVCVLLDSPEHMTR